MQIDFAVGKRARKAVGGVELRMHDVVASGIVRRAHGEPIHIAHAHFNRGHVRGPDAFFVQFDADADGRVIAAAAGVGLEAVFGDAPVAAETVGEDFRFHFVAFVQREQSRAAFQRAARAGQSVGCEKRARHRVARGKSRPQALGQHAIAHALRRAAGLMEGHAERMRKPVGVEL